MGLLDRRITECTEKCGSRSLISVRELCDLCEKLLFVRSLVHE